MKLKEKHEVVIAESIESAEEVDSKFWNIDSLKRIVCACCDVPKKSKCVKV